MTERYEPGDLPPDLPPEYAEAYRRGYERARAGEPGFVGEAPPLFADEVEGAFLEDVEPEPWYGPTHRDEQEGGPGWLVPALIGTCVLALVLGAYGLGRLFSDKSDDRSDTGSVAEQTPGRKTPRSQDPGVWEGDVRALSGVTAVASCVLPPGTDAAGRRVTYDAVNAVDEDYTTAWRCGGAGTGVKLTLELGRRVRLGELALVPGYAKTDPENGTDRYAENNRITKLRWTFSDGRTVVQTLDGSPVNRDLQFVRVAPVETDSVTLEILESARGPRNTVAISEIVLSETVG